MTATSSGSGLSRALRPTAKVLPEHARAHNRSLVLQSLFAAGRSTRADLARQTGLTRVTVSDLIADLLDEGLLEELGPRPGSHVGKPATVVGLKADAFHIATVDLSDDERLRGAIVDLTGTILTRKSVPLEGRTGEAAVRQVVTLSRKMVKAATRPVLGLGVGSPGLVRPDGTVVIAPNLDWSDVPLAARLAEAVDVPVYVANDARTAALAEHTFGGAQSLGLMVITVGHGVGAGLVLDGALIQGQHHAAGEIGHVTVDERGTLCACGRRGCLETVLSVPALRARIEGRSPKSADAALASVGRRLGVTLAPVISALNLTEIRLSGPADLLDGSLKEAALATIRDRTISFVGKETGMQMASLGADGVLTGAAALVLSGQLGVS